MDSNAIGKMIEAKRKSLNITQETLADLAMCSRATVIATEAGKSTLRLDVLSRIANVLGLDLTLTERNPSQ